MARFGIGTRPTPARVVSAGSQSKPKKFGLGSFRPTLPRPSILSARTFGGTNAK